MVLRRIQLQKTIKKLLKIIFRIYFFLEYHLKHGLPEILIRVVGVFDNGDAVLDFRAGADGFGVIMAEMAGGGVDVEREGGGGAILIIGAAAVSGVGAV